MPHRIITVSPPLLTSVWADDPTTIVLHATAGSSGKSSVNHLRSLGLGYHFIIARDGKDSAKTQNSDGTDPAVFFCVPLDNRAAHVGSNIPMPNSGGRIANRSSIGISLANRQTGEGYTPKQLVVLDEIISLTKAHWPSIRTLTTHAAIQPWNRRDPLNIDGPAMATRHGLAWFQPTPAQIAAFKP
jgi:N-acetyl-anhydromuramyl-L-alanine amidase AmpD